jgi:hypothetical protein
MDKLSVRLINAVSATTTSDGVDVSSFSKLSLQFSVTDVATGNGVYTVDVSNDNGTTWVPYNRLISNVTNTNVQTDTKVASVTLNTSATKAMVFIPTDDKFQMLRVTVTYTTAGKYSAILLAV